MRLRCLLFANLLALTLTGCASLEGLRALIQPPRFEQAPDRPSEIRLSPLQSGRAEWRRHRSDLDERDQSKSIRLHVEHGSGDAAARRRRGGRCRLSSRAAAAGATDRNHPLRLDGELCERAAARQCHPSGCLRARVELSVGRNGRRRCRAIRPTDVRAAHAGQGRSPRAPLARATGSPRTACRRC